MNNFIWLWKWAKPLKAGLLVGLILLALEVVFSISMVYVQKLIIDDVFIDKQYHLITSLLIVFIGSVLLYNLFHMLAGMRLNITSRRINVNLLEHYMKTMQKLPTRFFHNERTGRLTNYYNQEIASITRIYNNIFFDTFYNLLSFIILTVIIGAASLPILLGLFVVGGLFIPLGRYFAPRLRAASKALQEKRANLSVHLVEGISSTKEVLAFNRQEQEQSKLNRILDAILGGSLQEVNLQNKQLLFSESLRLGTQFLVLGYGGYAVMTGDLSIGMFVIVFQFSRDLMDAINGLYQTTMNVPAVIASVDRFREVLGQEQELDGHKQLKHRLQTMNWSNVEFQYSAEAGNVLNGVSFRAHRGEKLAFVGLSGGGKSTIAQLLIRFYKPNRGRIDVDGFSLQELTFEDWSNRVSIVFQDSYMYPETITSNLTLGRVGFSQQQLIEVCKAACIHEDIIALPDGYHTLLGERGITLSGGQRQRLAIARALLGDPELLILDEATSALDLETERQVMASLDEQGKNRITIIIAHRLSTVQNADVIHVMESGRISESGTHEELIARNQVYTILLRMQDHEADAAEKSLS